MVCLRVADVARRETASAHFVPGVLPSLHALQRTFMRLVVGDMASVHTSLWQPALPSLWEAAPAHHVAMDAGLATTGKVPEQWAEDDAPQAVATLEASVRGAHAVEASSPGASDRAAHAVEA